MLSQLFGFVILIASIVRTETLPVDSYSVPTPIIETVSTTVINTPTVDQSKYVFSTDELRQLLYLAEIPENLHTNFITLISCESGGNRLAKGDLHSDGYHRSLGLLQLNLGWLFPKFWKTGENHMTASEIHYLLDNGLVPAENDPYNPVTNLKTGYNIYLRLGTFGTTGGWANCAAKHNLP